MRRPLYPDLPDCIAETTRTMDAVRSAETSDAPERVKRALHRENLDAMRDLIDLMSGPGKRPKGFGTHARVRSGIWTGLRRTRLK
jgi:hypothetical protein